MLVFAIRHAIDLLRHITAFINTPEFLLEAAIAAIYLMLRDTPPALILPLSSFTMA